jgi:glycosyltransferase involved in cell wall biosynthesis
MRIKLAALDAWDDPVQAAAICDRWQKNESIAREMALIHELAALAGAKTVVELGVGSGQTARAVTNGDPSIYIGFEQSEVMLDRARAALPGFDLRLGGTTATRAAQADLLVAIGVIEHAEKPLIALDELASQRNQFLLIDLPVGVEVSEQAAAEAFQTALAVRKIEREGVTTWLGLFDLRRPRQKPPVLVVDPHLGVSDSSSFSAGLVVDLRELGFDVEHIKSFEKSHENAIVHVDWCDQNAVRASRTTHRRLTIRLHRWEMHSQWPGQVNWTEVDELIFVSEYQRRLFEKRFHRANPARISVAPALESALLLPFKQRGHGGDVAIVSRINAWKGVTLALQIIRRCPKRRFDWFGPIEDVHTAEYLELHAPSNLVLHAGVSHAQLMQVLQEGRFTDLLHCSISEGFPVAVAEAMALGLKPVVHAFPGAKEILPAPLVWTDIDEAVALLDAPVESDSYLAFIRERGQVRVSSAVLGPYRPTL